MQRDRHLRWKLSAIYVAAISTPTVSDDLPLVQEKGAAHHIESALRLAQISKALQAEMDWVSTRTPTPIVLETATFFK